MTPARGAEALLPRCHVPALLSVAAPGASLQLDVRSTQHLTKALRLRPGALLRVFGGGVEWLAQLAAAAAPRRGACATATLVRPLPRQTVPRCGPWLVASPPSSRARHAFLVEKATELGVRGIVPLVTDRSQLRSGGGDGRDDGDDRGDGCVAAELSVDDRQLMAAVAAFRLRAGLGLPVQPMRTSQAAVCAWALDAACQSERLNVPVLCPPLRLHCALALWTARGGTAVGGPRAADHVLAPLHALGPAASSAPSPFFAHDEGEQSRLLLVCDEALSGGTPDKARTIRSTLARAATAVSIGIVVGPEGGFSASERALFVALEDRQSGVLSGSDTVQRVTLGEGLLRVETAALVALSLVHAAIEGMS